MANQKERRKWALELAAALLRSDMDCFDLEEFNEAEQSKRLAAMLKVADELDSKAAKMAA